MECSIIVATFGDAKWARLAKERAIPSTQGQGALEVIALHLEGGTIAEARNEAARKASGDWLLLSPGLALEDLGYCGRGEIEFASES